MIIVFLGSDSESDCPSRDSDSDQSESREGQSDEETQADSDDSAEEMPRQQRRGQEQQPEVRNACFVLCQMHKAVQLPTDLCMADL